MIEDTQPNPLNIDSKEWLRRAWPAALEDAVRAAEDEIVTLRQQIYYGTRDDIRDYLSSLDGRIRRRAMKAAIATLIELGRGCACRDVPTDWLWAAPRDSSLYRNCEKECPYNRSSFPDCDLDLHDDRPRPDAESVAQMLEAKLAEWRHERAQLIEDDDEPGLVAYKVER